jgi:hypothetical protein
MGLGLVSFLVMLYGSPSTPATLVPLCEMQGIIRKHVSSRSSERAKVFRLLGER